MVHDAAPLTECCPSAQKRQAATLVPPRSGLKRPMAATGTAQVAMLKLVSPQGRRALCRGVSTVAGERTTNARGAAHAARVAIMSAHASPGALDVGLACCGSKPTSGAPLRHRGPGPACETQWTDMAPLVGFGLPRRHCNTRRSSRIASPFARLRTRCTGRGFENLVSQTIRWDTGWAASLRAGTACPQDLTTGSKRTPQSNL